MGQAAVSANCFVPVVCHKSVDVNSRCQTNALRVTTHIEKVDVMSTLLFHLSEAFDEVKLAFQPVRSDQVIDDRDIAFKESLDDSLFVF